MTEQERKLNEVYEWMLQKKRQQITMPLDEGSLQAIGCPVYLRAGASALTQTYSDSRGDTLIGPKAYAGVITIILPDGKLHEVPVLT